MGKPTINKIKKWFEKRFDRKPEYDKTYFNQWKGRFETPVKVWSYSDSDSRRILKLYFKKFKGISLDTNLNNPEYENKFNEW